MFNFSKFINSFRYALAGISYAIKYNQNIKVHFVIAFLVLIFGFILGLTRYEMFGVGVLIVLVISAEMINSAIEEVVDLLVKEHSQEAKIAKDVSAGMVLIIVLFSAVVGIFIFLPHIINLFG
jgi:diacylglycerol kinase